jgi:hypothetical protein
MAGNNWTFSGCNMFDKIYIRRFMLCMSMIGLPISLFDLACSCFQLRLDLMRTKYLGLHL